MNYRAEIDGLRALAVMPVILFHAGFEWFSGGYVGVDVFFVISGYLITTIIISEMAEGKFSIINFYERRARRILPVLFFVMAACLPFAWLWLTPSDLKDFGQSLVAASIFSSNILFWLESGYFDTATELKPLLHTWSLAVEEQYYILFPIFLILLGIKRAVILLPLVFVASLGAAQWGALNEPSATFYLLPTRGWELLVGVFAAFYLKYNTYLKSHAVNQIFSLLGFGMIVYSIVAFDETTPFPSLYALVPTIGTGLLILTAVPKTFVHHLLSVSPIVGIGLISYSAYLWHQPLLAFAHHRLLGELSDLFLITLCIASLVMAWFSWRFVEKPFRDKKKTNRKFIFCFSLVGVISFSIIGLFIHKQDGYFEYIHKINPLIKFGDIGHDGFHSYVSDNFIECENETLARNAGIWNGFLRCQQTQAGDPTIALFGDSHAEYLFLGIAEQSQKNAIYLSRGGDAFLGEVTHQYLIDHILETDEIDTILYSIYWSEKYNKLGEENLERRVLDTLMTFKNANKKVVLVADVPDFIFDAKSCYFINRFNEDKNSCSISLDDYQQQRTYLPMLNSLAEELDLELIDPKVLFCNDEECHMVKDHTILYRDNDHLNIPASLMIGKFIVENSTIID